jgi:membrane protease YdiL (CAAX protease family)
MTNQPKHESVLSERVWPVVRVLLLYLLFFSQILGNIAAMGVFILVIDKLGWMNIKWRGHTLETVAPSGMVLGHSVVILVNFALVVLFWRFLDRKRLTDMLWDLKPGWSPALSWGLLAGLAQVLVVYGLLWISGAVDVVWGLGMAGESAWRIALGWFIVSCVLAPINEEALYRGYIFQNVKRGWGVAAGIIVSALIFGGIHLLNPNAELLGGMNIVLTGVIWALGMLYFRSLWFPIGWHATWNFAQFFIVGLPNSGYTAKALGVEGTTLLVSELSGPNWLVGGEFGMEASIVQTVTQVIAIVILLYLIKRKPNLHICRQTAGKESSLQAIHD